jgi:hypothetical protein
MIKVDNIEIPTGIDQPATHSLNWRAIRLSGEFAAPLEFKISSLEHSRAKCNIAMTDASSLPSLP